MATNSKKENPDKTSFEDALEELESIVEEMESEKMPLERLVESYEKGTQLLKVCQESIDSAQAKIELIAKRAGEEGGVELADFAAGDAKEGSGGKREAGAAEQADEIELL